MDNITPKQMADALQIHYRAILLMLAAGTIPAKKSKGDKGRWVVLASDFTTFTKRNTAKLAALRKKYVGLYRGGVTVKALTERTPADMAKEGIIYHDIKGFTEWTIYDFVMKEAKATQCEVYGNGKKSQQPLKYAT